MGIRGRCAKRHGHVRSTKSRQMTASCKTFMVDLYMDQSGR
jgi:hypothetical protein